MSLANNFTVDSENTVPLNLVGINKRQLRKTPLWGAYAALLLFMVIYCVRPEDWVPGMSHVPLAKLVGIMALLALAVSLQHIRDRMPREVYFLILLTVQLFVASLVSTVWRGGALQITFNFAKVLLVILMIATSVTTLRRLRLLIFAQALSISVIASVTIWKERTSVSRLEGILGGQYADPNDLALAIIISLPLCLALLIPEQESTFGKILWSISILVMLYAVFLTGSRGGFLALVVAAVVALWEFAIQGRRRYLLALAGFAGLFLFLSAGGKLVGRLQGTFNVNDTTSAYESAQSRQQLFWRSIKVTMEHPIFGVGPGNFNQVSGTWHTTHNSLTLMSSEGGIPALFLYVLILVYGFKNVRATKRLTQGTVETRLLVRALLASLAGYAVGSLFLSVAFQFFPYILVAYTTALFEIARKLATKSRKLEPLQNSAGENKELMDVEAPGIYFYTA